MSSPAKLSIYVLTYNRPDTVCQTIESILTQGYREFELIVSDNSSGAETQKLLEKYISKNQIKYIKRVPSLPAISHFNAVLASVSSEYFMMFHDDDILKNTAIKTMIDELDSRPSLAAVACNAHILQNQVPTQNRFMSRFQSPVEISSPLEMTAHYIKSGQEHPPFPSYIYRSNKVIGLDMNFKQGKKHSDVSFLIKVAGRGPVRWLPDCLMMYRKHAGNDSGTIDLKAIFSLCSFLKKNSFANASELNDFKMRNCALWLRQQTVKSILAKARYRTLARAVFFFTLRNPQLITKRFIK